MKNRLLISLSILVIIILLGFGSGILGFRGELATFSVPHSIREFITGPTVGGLPQKSGTNIKIETEESVTIDVVKKISPAVVTVGITQIQSSLNPGSFFNPFGPFGQMIPQQPQGGTQIKQDIGSGFAVRSDGLIITNKHVVSETTAKYRVITADNKSYDVQKIWRDPSNDLAILKIKASNLPTVELGDSSHLQVGQFALAIGTALGEFRSTVTTGVISGIGRSITAGSPFTGSEQLSNILQTSAAINPGNSGGPLLNSGGQVIGINVAVASDAQNIGFALPINLVKESLNTFETTGAFKPRAYLGVSYQMVSRDLAILNEIPEGAYIQTVIPDSPADKAGVEQGDIITKINGISLRDSNGGLSVVISTKKVGDTVTLDIFRDDNKTLQVKATLSESQQ